MKIRSRRRHSHAEAEMIKLLHAFIDSDSGATAIEYGLIASLISVAIITAATTLGTNIANTFNSVAGNLK